MSTPLALESQALLPEQLRALLTLFMSDQTKRHCKEQRMQSWVSRIYLGP